MHVPAELAPTDLVALTIEIPDDMRVEDLDVAKLPVDWSGYVDLARCRTLGDAWVASGVAAVLRVPAAPVPDEHNYLVSVAHPESSRITVVSQRPFQFDPRLAK